MKKKSFALLLAAMLAFALAAGAETLRPEMSVLLRELVAGKTFRNVRLTGCVMEDGAGRATLTFALCERERFPAAQVEALVPGDTIVAGGDIYTVRSVMDDEWGRIVNEGDPDEGCLIFDRHEEDGVYTATTDTDNPMWQTAVSITCEADGSLVYLDFSDPEDDEPIVLGFGELMRRIENEEIFLDENNTTITFDENGKLTELLQTYSPWN